MEIRLASGKDAEGVLKVYEQYLSTPITFELEAPSNQEMQERIEHTLLHYPWLVAIDGDKTVGYAYGHAFRDRPAYRWTVETSVYVDSQSHGKGIGKALYERLFAILVQQRFVLATAGITLPNEPSIRLHQSFEFKPVGVFANVGYKNGSWHDVGFYERTLNKPRPDQPEPLNWRSVVETLA